MAGPYGDYLCRDEYAITIDVPADLDELRIGVAGLDLLVADVQRELTRRFAGLVRHVTLTTTVGRVVVSTDPGWATGDSIRGSQLAILPGTACNEVALTIFLEAK